MTKTLSRLADRALSRFVPVLVSHRLSAVRDADRILVLVDGRIVVLVDGRIVEDGDHETLLAAGGPYAELFTLQAAGYQESPA